MNFDQIDILIFDSDDFSFDCGIDDGLLFCHLLVFLVFACVTIGFWLSSIFGSYIVGFGYTTGIIAIITLLLFLGRKQLFINPIIRLIIKEQTSNHEQA